ncbi:MAG: hypothetical protein ACM3NT_05725 [Methylocystaceae bacterium]
MEKLAQVLRSNRLSEYKNPPSFDQSDMFFGLDCSQDRMTALVVKTETADGWGGALQQLQRWEEQAQLNPGELMGKLTLLVGTPCRWTELLEEACTVIPCSEALGLHLEQGMLACLPVDQQGDETFYLCGLDNTDSASVQFISRRLPLWHGSIIRLRALDGLLHDRHLAIGNELEKLEKSLVQTLHSKLVMAKGSLTVTEELELEINGLASGYSKLVGDQKLILDGVKRLDLLLSNLERRLSAESGLKLPQTWFRQLTESYQQRRIDLLNIYDQLKMVREDYQAAIEVVQSKIDIMNSRTNISTQEQIKGLLEINTSMQKQSLVFQYAAGLIEFIVLAYYSHTLWSHLAHAAYLAIPAWLQFVMVMLFSGNTVILTHLLAEYKHGEQHVGRKIIIAAITLALIILVILIASGLTGSHGAAD